MIISRAPVRISLGGGGTDLPSYYTRYGGYLIAGAIDKYIYVALNKRFHDSIRLSYSTTEIVDNVEDIKHPIFRECLRFTELKKAVELVSIADVPANCGLGSSSSFTVSLLNALHAYKREYVQHEQLAQEACNIEIDTLHEPIGKQDQYIAAYGGITEFVFNKDHTVEVKPLRISNDVADDLNKNILLFHTGIERKSSEVLADQNKKTQQGDSSTVEILHKIRQLGYDTKIALEMDRLEEFGDILNEHWNIKKELSTKVTHPFIDSCYNMALKYGAKGGKIMGAGGGGFFMFYCPEKQKQVRDAMLTRGLRPMKFSFDYDGAKIIANMRRRVNGD